MSSVQALFSWLSLPFFCQVADQLCAKYSKEYGKLCRSNQIGTVNDRVSRRVWGQELSAPAGCEDH